MGVSRTSVLALAASLVAGSLFAARPVARWDVVPYQRITGDIKLGVVAFHESDVKVVFKVNGRKKWVAKRMSKNDRTGVEEFVFPFSPKGLKAGPVTIGATAVANDEECDLPDIVLYADPNSELGSRAEIWVDPVKGNDFAEGAKSSPVKTLGVAVKKAGDGGTVLLAKGRYDLNRIGIGKRREYWTLVTTAPGTERKDVRIKGGRPITDKLLLRNVNLYGEVKEEDSASIYVGEGKHPLFAWFDNCIISNSKGRSSGTSTPFGNHLVAYVTGGITHDTTNGPRCELVRNHTVEKVAGSAFSGGGTLIVNCKVRDIDPDDTGITAPVLYEGYVSPPSWISDVILFNVEADECKSRGLVGSRLRNAAFVNVKFAATEKDESNLTRFSLGIENILFRNVEIANQDWIWVDKEYGLVDPEPVDVVMENVKVENYLGCDVSGKTGIRKK